jgi:hypothetical protein
LPIGEPSPAHRISDTASGQRSAGWAQCVVEAQPAGRYTYYRLRPEVLERLAQQFAGLAEAAQATTAMRRPCD